MIVEREILLAEVAIIRLRNRRAHLHFLLVETGVSTSEETQLQPKVSIYKATNSKRVKMRWMSDFRILCGHEPDFQVS